MRGLKREGEEMKITNTSKHGFHPEWLLGANPKEIERQEAIGQNEFVKSECLPSKVNSGELRTLTERGVVLGVVIDDDPLFRMVILPKGWVKRPTEHPMWSELVDDAGNVVATIFYKAAFYDRCSFMNIKEEPKCPTSESR